MENFYSTPFYSMPWSQVEQTIPKASKGKKFENRCLKARFHYEREMEHSLYLLYTFPRLKSKRALRKAKNQQNKEYSALRF